MNAAQKIDYIQSEYDQWDREQFAIARMQLAIINDFKTEGFTGSRHFPDDTVKSVIYDAISEETAELLEAMFMAGDDEEKLRDASFAVKNHLIDLIEERALELAENMAQEKEDF